MTHIEFLKQHRVLGYAVPAVQNHFGYSKKQAIIIINNEDMTSWFNFDQTIQGHKFWWNLAMKLIEIDILKIAKEIEVIDAEHIKP